MESHHITSPLSLTSLMRAYSTFIFWFSYSHCWSIYISFEARTKICLMTARLINTIWKSDFVPAIFTTFGLCVKKSFCAWLLGIYDFFFSISSHIKLNILWFLWESVSNGNSIKDMLLFRTKSQTQYFRHGFQNNPCDVKNVPVESHYL